MMAIPNPTQLLIGAVSFLRIGGIIFTMPVFGDNPTPLQARIILSVCLTVALYPFYSRPWELSPFPNDLLVFFSLVLKELIIGLVLGLVARLGFDGIVAAASVVASQMGFGSDRLFLVDLESEIDGFSALHRMVIMIIFLSLGLHSVFFAALMESFRLIPPGGAGISGPLLNILITATGNILSIAIQLAAPVLIALLFTTAALGLVSRAVPQLNAFSMSFPISFIVGLIVYAATIPLFPDWISSHSEDTKVLLHAVMVSLTK
jgi:flagellar biosynthetic protein FliR